MGKLEKLYQHILIKISDLNVSFESLCSLLINLGFNERIKDDHHIFTKEGIDEILNLQPKNGKGMPYQIKKLREIFLKPKLSDFQVFKAFATVFRSFSTGIHACLRGMSHVSPSEVKPLCDMNPLQTIANALFDATGLYIIAQIR